MSKKFRLKEALRHFNNALFTRELRLDIRTLIKQINYFFSKERQTNTILLFPYQ